MMLITQIEVFQSESPNTVNEWLRDHAEEITVKSIDLRQLAYVVTYEIERA